MKSIAVFKPQFNKEEQEEITDLSNTIWKMLANDTAPINTDGNRYFVRHSIKIEIRDEVVIILDTGYEPFIPIYNRYILKLLVENIMEE